MKILLDTCVWGGVVLELRAAGHDVVWAGDWQEDPGDDEILERAHGEGRVLVTLDKDFGELAIVHERPHSGIIRLVKRRDLNAPNGRSTKTHNLPPVILAWSMQENFREVPIQNLRKIFMPLIDSGLPDSPRALFFN